MALLRREGVAYKLGERRAWRGELQRERAEREGRGRCGRMERKSSGGRDSRGEVIFLLLFLLLSLLVVVLFGFVNPSCCLVVFVAMFAGPQLAGC